MALKLCVVVSDLHCGSSRGLMPPVFVTLEGQRIKPSDPQAFLWEQWLAADKWKRKIIGKDPWACVVNGDAIEGNHHGTTELISPEVSDHVDCAIASLEPFLAGASKVYFTLGTNAHVKESEHHLARYFKAEQYTGRRPAFERLSVRFHGCLCRFTHHTSTSTRPWLQANKLLPHLVSAQQEAIGARKEPPTVTCAAHCHTYARAETPNALSLTTPSWQILTRYTNKVAPNAVAHIGIVILDWRGKQPGDLPEVHPFTRAYWSDEPVEA